MSSKTRNRIVYLLLLLSMIGVGIYAYLAKDTLKAAEIKFVAVEKPQSEIVGIWNEISQEDVKRRLIFTETSYTLMLQDGITPDKNMMISTGGYSLNDDNTITLKGDRDDIQPILIETPESKKVVTLSMGENNSFFYGMKVSDQTDQMEMEKELQAQQQSGRQMVTYLSPSGV